MPALAFNIYSRRVVTTLLVACESPLARSRHGVPLSANSIVQATLRCSVATQERWERSNDRWTLSAAPWRQERSRGSCRRLEVASAQLKGLLTLVSPALVGATIRLATRRIVTMIMRHDDDTSTRSHKDPAVTIPVSAHNGFDQTRLLEASSDDWKSFPLAQQHPRIFAPTDRVRAGTVNEFNSCN